MSLNLNTFHLDVLSGIDECPDGRMTTEREATVLPTPDHQRALVELRRHHYVFRRWLGSKWHPRAVHKLTKHGRAAIAPTLPDRPDSGITLG